VTNMRRTEAKSANVGQANPAIAHAPVVLRRHRHRHDLV
jgi:hypothetical protein